MSYDLLCFLNSVKTILLHVMFMHWKGLESPELLKNTTLFFESVKKLLELGSLMNLS